MDDPCSIVTYDIIIVGVSSTEASRLIPVLFLPMAYLYNCKSLLCRAVEDDTCSIVTYGLPV